MSSATSPVARRLADRAMLGARRLTKTVVMALGPVATSCRDDEPAVRRLVDQVKVVEDQADPIRREATAAR